MWSRSVIDVESVGGGMSTETDDGDGRAPAALTGLDGDADFGRTARSLYATDASIYRAEPAGVVRPASRADVRRTVEYARRHDSSVVARGAGSSLTGAAVGSGIVLDCSRHLDEVVEIDPESKTATVQPGVVLDELNETLAEEGLYFPPDPSTSSTCTIGGMVANDAAGPHSVRHGTTRDNVRGVECVLADGSVADFERRTGEDLRRVCARDDRSGTVHDLVRTLRDRHAEEIDERYPSVERNSSGYDLQTAAAADGSWVDLSKLLVGSEGTLGIVTEVTIELTERPAGRATALVCYEGLLDAARAVQGALEADPSAIELVDDTVLDHAREAWGIDLVPPWAGAALLVEVEVDADADADADAADVDADADADSDATNSVSTDPGSDGAPASESEALTRRLEEAVTAARTDATLAVERATDASAQSTLWKVRKASNPLLNRHPGDEQALAFVEDAAVPPERLPEYLDAVGDILCEHDLTASVFGHAGQGVLHVKPFLNLKQEADRERLRAVSEAVHEVVIELGGCVSGEHGDGMLRSQYLPDMYGEELYGDFVEVKRAFDPHDVFNPAKVVPDSDGDLATVDDGLRYEGYDPEAVETALDFDEERGFGSLPPTNRGSRPYCRGSTMPRRIGTSRSPRRAFAPPSQRPPFSTRPRRTTPSGSTSTAGNGPRRARRSSAARSWRSSVSRRFRSS